MRCAHSFGFSEVLLISTQSYFLSEICVTANQQHSHCLPIVILTASNLHKFCMHSPGSAQKCWGHLHAISAWWLKFPVKLGTQDQEKLPKPLNPVFYKPRKKNKQTKQNNPHQTKSKTTTTRQTTVGISTSYRLSVLYTITWGAGTMMAMTQEMLKTF